MSKRGREKMFTEWKRKREMEGWRESGREGEGGWERGRDGARLTEIVIRHNRKVRDESQLALILLP